MPTTVEHLSAQSGSLVVTESCDRIPECSERSNVITAAVTCRSECLLDALHYQCNPVAVTTSVDRHLSIESMATNTRLVINNSKQLGVKDIEPSSSQESDSVAQAQMYQKVLRYSSNFRSSAETGELVDLPPRILEGSVLCHVVQDVDRCSSRSEDLYSRLLKHGMRLGHGCERLMQVAVEACHRQMTFNDWYGSLLAL